MPDFQHRHYEAIASMMKATKPDSHHQGDSWQWRYTVQEMCKLFRNDNARFQEARFRKACGECDCD